MTAAVLNPVRRIALKLESLSPAVILAFVAAMSSALVDRSIFNDPDTYWHIAAGGWMFDHAQVLRHDVFSYTYPGRPWASHEWLAEVIMALAYRAAGWNGILLLFAGAMGLAGGLLARGIGRWLGPVGQTAALVMAFLTVSPTVLARPHLLMLPILIGWTMEMLAAREEGRAPRWWFALILAVWANLHGSFVFGFVLAGGFALDALIAPGANRLKAIRQWGVFGVLCLAAAFATPHGLLGLIAPFKILGMSTLNEIKEWRPANFGEFSALEAGILVTLLVCLSKGVRVPLARLLLLLLIFHMTLQHQRQSLVLAAIAPLLLAKPIGQAFGRTAKPQAMSWPAKAILAGLVLVIAAVRLAVPTTRGDDYITPAGALAHVPPSLAAKPVLNAYNFGGYLIFSGVKTFIDGRADMYGDDFVKRYGAAIRADPASLERVLTEYNIAWTIAEPTQGLVKAMDARPGWRRIYADKNAVVHARIDALPPARPAQR